MMGFDYVNATTRKKMTVLSGGKSWISRSFAR